MKDSGQEQRFSGNRGAIWVKGQTGQRSNQSNYVLNRGINNLEENLANKGFARFAVAVLTGESKK